MAGGMAGGAFLSIYEFIVSNKSGGIWALWTAI